MKMEKLNKFIGLIYKNIGEYDEDIRTIFKGK